jgi:hypothetical protein
VAVKCATRLRGVAPAKKKKKKKNEIVVMKTEGMAKMSAEAGASMTLYQRKPKRKAAPEILKPQRKMKAAWQRAAAAAAASAAKLSLAI